MHNSRKIFKALLIFGSVFLLNTGYSQTYELGALTGFTHYKGEVSPTIHPLNLGLNGQLIGRYNIDHFSSLRLNLSQAVYSASDSRNNNNLSKRRNTDIRGDITEGAILYEYNFFPFREKKSNILTTPYLLGGIGYMQYEVSGGKESSTQTSSLVIPFGIGLKTMLSKTLNLNVEFVTRKTFTDYLDNSSDQVKGVQNGYKETNDWYSLFSIGITYTFYPIICPEHP